MCIYDSERRNFLWHYWARKESWISCDTLLTSLAYVGMNHDMQPVSRPMYTINKQLYVLLDAYVGMNRDMQPVSRPMNTVNKQLYVLLDAYVGMNSDSDEQ